MKKCLLFLLGSCTAGLPLFLQTVEQHLYPEQRQEGLFGFLKDLILKSGAEECKVGRTLESKLFLNKSRETVTRAFISFCSGTNRKSPPNIIQGQQSCNTLAGKNLSSQSGPLKENIEEENSVHTHTHTHPAVNFLKEMNVANTGQGWP